MITKGFPVLVNEKVLTATGKVLESLPEKYEFEDNKGDITWLKEDFAEQMHVNYLVHVSLKGNKYGN